MSPALPDLTFACELEPEPLRKLFDSPEVVPFLREMKATVALGMLDLSDARAQIVRDLNDAGVPVTAWLLLPKDQGYWFNLDNHPQAVARYEQFHAWSSAHGLRWARIGLDIEPDIRALKELSANRVGRFLRMFSHIFDNLRLMRGSRAYHGLVEQIHADGYEVETYQFPFIVDERMAKSSLLQRITGLVDLPEADREVLMLYSSFLRPWGQGVLWSYAPNAASIGVGSTGGGVELEGALSTRPLNWMELQTDLLLARRHTENIFIFSLEGCVEQKFLPMLRDMDWQGEINLPILYAQRTDSYRKIVRRVMWLFSKPAWLLFALALVISGIVAIRRKKTWG